ncbi:unnamed protein product [Discula destructiva]
MKEAEHSQLRARYPTLKPLPQIFETQAEQASPEQPRRRRCEENTEAQVLSDTTFNNWDVAMSPVVGAQGGSAPVSVTEGYSLANRLVVTTGGLFKSIAKSIMGDAFMANIDKTWTTSQTQTLTFTVPDGQYGLIVSQPFVRRIEGKLLTGCIDSQDSADLMVDLYESTSYGDLSWVNGIIRLCNSTSYPVPYCIGEGFHE